MTFSKQIKAIRETRALTQAETADILGISKSALEKWEAGTKIPKPLTQEGAIARLTKGKPKKI